MKSILFFIESLDGGGAEGALERIVTAADKNKFSMNVVSENASERRVERIKNHSKYHGFIYQNGSEGFLKKLWNKIIIKFSVSFPETMVRRFLIRGKYDIEVAFCEGYATRLIGNSKRIANCKKVAWIHTDFVNNPWSREVFGSAEAEKRCYENFDAIVCVSQTIKDSFIKTYGMEEKTHVIYNYIDIERIEKKINEPLSLKPEKPLFMLAGSFMQVKGYDRMVRVSARLRDDGFNFHVIIMGIGYCRDEIEKLMDELNMTDYITLMEYQSNPYQYMAAADAYVCSSRAEGYSTTVNEAIIAGLPVITTACSGMEELFGGMECGIICENSEDGLYLALKKVLDHPELFETFRDGVKLRAKAMLEENRIGIIEQFFEEI